MVLVGAILVAALSISVAPRDASAAVVAPGPIPHTMPLEVRSVTSSPAGTGGGSAFGVTTLSDGGGPYGIAYDALLDTMAVTNDNNYTVSLYNASSLTKSSEPSVNRPRMVAINQAAGLAYVADFDGYVHVLNLSTSTVTDTVSVGLPADGIGYAPQAASMYVTSFYDSNVTVISATNDSVVTNIPLSGCPETPAYDAQNNTVFIANSCSDVVTVVNATSNQVVENLRVASPPAAAAYDAVTNVLWAGANSGNLSAFNASTYAWLGSASMGGGVRALAIDPALGWLYDLGSNTIGPCVQVVNMANTSVFDTVNLSGISGTPYSLAVDTSSHSVWVTEFGFGVLVLAPVRQLVSFVESGLADGTSWTVTADGVSANSTTSRVSLSLLEGTYSYVIQPVPGYTTDRFGNVTVSGTTPSVNVTFSPVTYGVAFDESGLPDGTLWGVTFAGRNSSSIQGTITFEQPNGTWSYFVDTVPGFATTWSGSVILDGAAKSVSVAFIEARFAVQLIESGLPSGTNWTVTIGSMTVGTVAASLTISEPNGSYGYTSSSADPQFAGSSGSFAVNGAAYSILVPFHVAYQTVTFNASGLPAGASWTVELDADLSTSTTADLTFSQEAFGNHTFTVLPPQGFNVSPRTGTITVATANLTVELHFAGVFLLTLTETGLPARTNWSVELNDSEHTSASNQITFMEPSGSYSFAVLPVAGYSVTPRGGTIVVNLAAANQQVSFAPVSSSTGNATGSAMIFGLSPTRAYGVLGVVIAGVAAIVLLLVWRSRRASSPGLQSDSTPAGSIANGTEDPPHQADAANPSVPDG
jgi:YVTN family beta-propeller protein